MKAYIWAMYALFYIQHSKEETQVHFQSAIEYI